MLALLVASCGNPARADGHYTFDQQHTSITFSVGQLGFFQVNGIFRDYDGSFIFCSEHPEKDAVIITLYAAGVHTVNGEWDDRLQGEDFFDAVHFPALRFVSTAVNLVAKDKATITGDLTLLGVTKPLRLDAHFTAKENDADIRESDVVTFWASGVLKRSEFGMNHLRPFIGDQVRLNVVATAIGNDHTCQQ